MSDTQAKQTGGSGTGNKGPYRLRGKRLRPLEYFQKERERVRERTRQLRLDVIEKAGGKCVRCGFDDPRALQFDHVHGGGNEERKRTKDTGAFDSLKKLERFLKLLFEGKYQLLCANCNWIKRVENGEVRRG